MESKVVSTNGKELRNVELSETVFGLPINDDVVWYAINNELANARVGTACTKDGDSGQNPYINGNGIMPAGN